MLILNEWASRGTALYASGQIVREYLSVATRPVDRNGLGLKQAAALANIRALRARASLLAEDVNVADRLLNVLDDVPCSGKRVHGVESLITLNAAGFSRFEQHIMLIPLSAVG